MKRVRLLRLWRTKNQETIEISRSDEPTVFSRPEGLYRLEVIFGTSNSDSDLRSTTLEASNIDVFEESVPKRSAIGSLGQALLGDKHIIGGK
jgi:hypothetical protein